MYYEIKMTRMGIDDNGNDKKFTELYLVDALSAMEALSKFEESITAMYLEHEVIAVKRVSYSEVVTDESDKIYFKTTLNTIVLNEVSQKEKKVPQTLLIQANDYDSAKAKLEKIINEWLVDVELKGLVETKVLDYFS